MTTNNSVNTSLNLQTGTGKFVGDTSPTIITPVINQINDASGNPVVAFGSRASAVNYISIYNGATNQQSNIQCTGADASISMALEPKNGDIFLKDLTNTIAPGIRWFNAGGSQYTALRAAVNQTTTVSFTLPQTDGTPGQVMQTDGSGNLSFISPGKSASQYTVSKVSGQGNFTTIQAAINQAVSDGASLATPLTVWIFSGDYTENLTLQPYVNLAAASDPSEVGVNVIGNAVYSGTGDFSITNIGFTTNNSSAAISFQSAGTAACHLQSVAIDGASGIGLECTSATTTLQFSIGSLKAATGGKCKNITDGNIEFFSGLATFTDTASTISGGTLRIIGCDITDAYDVSGGLVEVFGSLVQSSSFPCFNIATGATVYTTTSSLGSSSTYFIDGTGTLGYSNISPLGSSFIINPTLAVLPLPTFSGITNIKTLISAPPDSQSSSLSLGAAYQNTLGYDVVLTVYLAVASATTADILLGVGSTNTPTQQTVISGLTLAALNVIPVTIYLPNNYYALLSTSGTISITISGQSAMPV